MKITFLGTGTSQGVPLIACRCRVCTSTNPKDKRLRTSVMIEDKENVFVIDTGPDFRQQMLREQVMKLDAIIFTHEHKDHIAGLDDVRAFNYVQQRAMDVFATERVQEALKREFAYIFNDSDYPGIPKIKLHTIQNVPFDIYGTTFIPLELMHFRLPILGFRVDDFVYITDTNFIPDHVKEKIKGAKVLAINALRREKHISHFTLAEALKMIEELKPENAYLIHISHQLGLHNEVEEELPANVHCAYDGLKLEI